MCTAKSIDDAEHSDTLNGVMAGLLIVVQTVSTPLQGGVLIGDQIGVAIGVHIGVRAVWRWRRDRRSAGAMFGDHIDLVAVSRSRRDR